MTDYPTAPKYLPTALLDEAVPPLRNSPDDWIVTLPDGRIVISDGYDEETEDAVALSDGERIGFSTMVTYGRATLTLHDDGTWSVDVEMPAGAELVIVPGDPTTISGSVEELAALILRDGWQPGECDLSYYTWSEVPPLAFSAAKRAFVAAQ